MAESLSSKPSLTIEEARDIAATQFSQTGTLHELPSERDQNFKIHTNTQEDWVLKFANSDTPFESIQLQQDIAQHLNARFGEAAFPGAAPNSENTLTRIQNSRTGQLHYCRLVPFRQGVTWAAYSPIDTNHWEALGQLLGRMTRELQSFQHPGAQRHLQWDLAHCSTVIREGLNLVAASDDQDEINKALDHYEKHVQVIHKNVRQSVIHGDANDHNLIIANNASPNKTNRLAHRFRRCCSKRHHQRTRHRLSLCII